MNKSVSKASVRNNAKKAVRVNQPPAQGESMTTFFWLSRVFSVLCFALVAFTAVISLSLIHIAKESEVNSVLTTSPTYSENLAYFQPLHPDMPPMDILGEMFVRQYITARNNVWKNAKEMRIMWGGGGLIYHLSSSAVYNDFAKKEIPAYFKDLETPPTVMIETDIKKIIKEGWNSWQIFFDTRKMETSISSPEIEHWIATIQFRYYSWNATMVNRLLNPLGFTVTRYNLARQNK